jgi:hypothetical protein
MRQEGREEAASRVFSEGSCDREDWPVEAQERCPDCIKLAVAPFVLTTLKLAVAPFVLTTPIRDSFSSVRRFLVLAKRLANDGERPTNTSL